jgi:hypothetical protein
MTIQIAHVDLSALTSFNRMRAGALLRRAVDPHSRLRMALEESIAPPEIRVAFIAPGLLQLAKVVA